MALTDLLSSIRNDLGPGGVLTGDEVTQRSTGWISRENMRAAAIVRPRSTEEASLVLRRCHDAGQTVVPHGGLTGLVEGAHTEPGDIALSLERMNQIEELDEAGLTMTVQAGVVLQAIQQRAEAAGLFFPLDLGARGSAMIGGLISTNAGGNRVIRYGMTRNLVLGLEAVLADGTVVSSLYPIIKNNSGYDLKQLFIGSEGTLGIVTRAVLRLLPQPRSQNTAFLAVNEFAHLPRLLRDLSAGLGGTLSAFEVMWNEFYRLVTTPPARQNPVLPQSFPYYVLVDAQGSDQKLDQERFESVLMQAVDKGLAADCVVAMSANERQAIWAMRDDVDQFHQYRPWFGFDVSMPIRHMESYVAGVRAQLNADWPNNVCFVFGHMGDGNLHLNIHVGSGDAESRKRVESIVYGGLAGRQGSISAEHGVGLEKRDYLKLCRTDAELRLMRTLKRAMDPNGILNPGKILEALND
ncbi:MAG TPA: FAD-binding oxidoreductase [Bryobacteraceae bacterium]|nr:FAD-binding oxidoreductase [Bryobacteraceae bacterium]